MNEPVTIRHLTPKNFLSFGPENPGIELKALNVLIGPNGCGKSNFIEALNFMRASTGEFREVIRNGGGVQEWTWKGGKEAPSVLCNVLCNVDDIEGPSNYSHLVQFGRQGQQFYLLEERIEEFGNKESGPELNLKYSFHDEINPTFSYFQESKIQKYTPNFKQFSRNQSILAQSANSDSVFHLTSLFFAYRSIRIYRDWPFGSKSTLRDPQKVDSRSDYLQEDFSNLAIYLNRIKVQFPKAKRAILEGLGELYPGIDNFEVLVEGGSVQLYLIEGDYNISATRLSDGTLHYLCLLAILCDPEPPAVICIEEPEVGLHPDVLPYLAQLLISASERTQLIVTTHSDVLVDSLTEKPETVVVCSKEEGQTKMERLSSENLKEWLKDYRLGELWTRGHIGGNRW
ncbi:MAG: AAA family ATPase [Candidatus Methylacidiphilales bacterium]|nr:AAA family ATPase [Candidatus Methylacidiphilales bacterium]